MSISRGTRLAGLGRLALGSLLGLASPAHADYPVAPDVVVFCEPTLQHVVADIGALWRARTGIKVRVFTSPTPALLQQIAHHARDDVVIGEGDAEADAGSRPTSDQEGDRRSASGAIISSPRRLPASSDGADGGSPSADKLAAIAGKEPIAVVDPWAATAGADSQKALQSLGPVAGGQRQVDRRRRYCGRGLPVGARQGEARDCLCDRCRRQSGIRGCSSLCRRQSYPPVVYWVAQTEHALSPNASKFITFLRSADAQQRARADGLEILP